MKKSRILRIAAFALVIILAGSCQKESIKKQGSQTNNNDTKIVADVNENSDNFYFDMQGSAFAPGQYWDKSKDKGCAVITDSGNGFPKVITMNFDSCKHKSGTITIEITDSLKNPGAERTVTYDKFVSHGTEINGYRKFTNLGPNANGNPELLSQSDITVTINGKTSHYKREEKVEWIKGYDTKEWKDDEFLITGFEEYTDFDGNVRSMKITKPIHIARSCRYPLSGTVELKGGKKDGTIDYGDGECDNKGIFTDENGNETEVNLNWWWKFHGMHGGKCH